jgi:hypothetical protein
MGLWYAATPAAMNTRIISAAITTKEEESG